jgi:hypothetical protein
LLIDDDKRLQRGRRDGVPLRAAPKAKGRVKKAREAEVNEQLEAGLSRALGRR